MKQDLKNTIPIQSTKILFLLVQQKLMFDDRTGPVVNKIEQTHEIQLNFCIIQVLTRTDYI
jgi:hypothetical protein